MDTRSQSSTRMEAGRKFSDDYDIDVDFSVTESEDTSVQHVDDSDDVLSGMDCSTATHSKADHRHNKTKQNTDQRHQHQQQFEAFQSLLPLPEHPTRQRSAPRAIPISKPPSSVAQTQFTTGHSASQPSSAGSTASTFLNNLLDPAASTFTGTQISHTPPDQIATSYEVSHFGKRARSGVSTFVR